MKSVSFNLGVILIGLFMLGYSCPIANAEMPITEGCGGFRWGTDIRDFLNRFPTASSLSKGGLKDNIFVVGKHEYYGFENGKYAWYQRWFAKEQDFDHIFKEIQIKYGKPNEVDSNSVSNYYGWSADQKKELRLASGDFVGIVLIWYQIGHSVLDERGVLYVSFYRGR